MRDDIPHFIERTLKGCCDASGATYKLEIQRNFPVTVNDDAQTTYARSVAEAALGPEAAVDGRQVMGAEDFSYFAQKVPACFVFLGTRSDDPNTHFPNHHGKFDVDERALELGVGLYAALALDAPQHAP